MGKFIIAGLYPFPHSIEHHNSNASIIKIDGDQINVYSYEEEKLSGIKNDLTSSFAERSLMRGLKEMDIAPCDVDVWAISTPTGVDEKIIFELIFKNLFKIKETAKFLTIPHQMGHAGLSVYGSGFHSGIFLCIDGGGDKSDNRSLLWGTFDNNLIDIQGECPGYEGLAKLHDYVTESMGFSTLENGKSMGLSSYGKFIPDIEKFIREHLIIKNDICYNFSFSRYKKSQFRLHKLKSEGYDRMKISRSPEGFNNFYDFVKIYPAQDVGFTVQKFIENEIIRIIDKIFEKTHGRYEYLVLGGGFFQNILVNKIINDNKERWNLKGIYIPHGCSDNGISLGLCLYSLYNIQKMNISPELFPRDEKGFITPFTGPSFSSEEIGSLLNEYNLNFSLMEENYLLDYVTDALIRGEVIGWFQGKGEMGPRSLLARSVIADPRKPEIKDRVNQLLKKREWFMPYAPAVLSENAKDWFINSVHSPYMTIAFDVFPEKQNIIPSAVHVDGTARPNTITEKSDEKSYKLLKLFESKTGLPLILNTSFNRHGIPTISTPRQAIDHLLAGNIDQLCIGNFIVKRSFRHENQPQQKIIDPHLFEIAEYIKPLIRLLYFGSDEEIQNGTEKIKKSIQDTQIIKDNKIILEIENTPEYRKIIVNSEELIQIPVNKGKQKKPIDHYFDILQEYIINNDLHQKENLL